VPQSRLNFKKFLQVPLWILLGSIIPFALVARHVGDVPEIAYSESRADIVRPDDTVIEFARDPDGVPIKFWEKVGNVFASLGVSFSHGFPDHLPKVENEIPRFEVGLVDGVMPLQDSQIEKTRLSRTALESEPDNYIVKSAYRFRGKDMPDGVTRETICPCRIEIRNGRRFPLRFRGMTTIQFHQPNNPKQIRGVHRFGFFAGRLNSLSTLEVSCFSPTGELLGRQSNLSEGIVFMGFKSKRKIGWIEIQAVGRDKEYALASLSFGD